MMRDWTFARKLAAALATSAALTLVVAAIGILALRSVVASKDAVINIRGRNALLAQQLSGIGQQQRAAIRDYLLTGNNAFIDEVRANQRQSDDIIVKLQQSVFTEQGALMVRDIRRLGQDYQATVDRLLAQRGPRARLDALLPVIQTELVAQRREFEAMIASFLEREQRLLEEGRAESTATADRAILGVAVASAVAVIIAMLFALLLTRRLTHQIGSAVQSVQTSSAELQASASQQASSAKEQATAMAEITTTIAELLATSRQIAESAQRVSRIAEETAGSAQTGEGTIRESSESVTAIRKQVDGIVAHMLDLGRKSQEIGGILEIINELAEQTNILSVNAAIEAAGAGESGRRFSVVADEIRRLSDRVSGSTKEIRGLIQEIRAAVNSTVMTTETTAKSADAGVQHFAGVSTAFRQITTLVRATTEAAREIELSTKQQASAVEQVNVGVADVAQGAKETEVASSQMLETVSQLTSLSRDLSRLVHTS